MCEQCYEEYGRPAIINAAVRNAAKMIAKVYEFNSAGGNLHVVVDDYNLETETIQDCLDNPVEAKQWQDADEYGAYDDCARTLLAMTMDERVSALALYHGYLTE